MTGLVVGPAVAGELVQLEAAYDFTEAWLANRRFAGNTREAYRRDIRQFLQWCAERGLDPLQLNFLQINAWARWMEESTDERKPLAPASVARKMSAVSSWYAFIVKLGKLLANPASVADRPPVDRDFSPTVSFTRNEATRLIEVAAAGDRYIGAAGPLLTAWLVNMGTRATETTNIDIGDLGYNQGFRVVHLTLKGGRRQRRPLPAPLADLLRRYLAERAIREQVNVEELTGALFVDRSGNPLDRGAVYRFVRRLAKAAGLPNADKISPHSFRHAFASMARDAGAALEDTQQAMGHRDPRTTQNYNRHGRSLMHDPALLVAVAVARRDQEQDESAE